MKENESKKKKDFSDDLLADLNIDKEVGIFKIFQVLKTRLIKELIRRIIIRGMFTLFAE